MTPDRQRKLHAPSLPSAAHGLLITLHEHYNVPHEWFTGILELLDFPKSHYSRIFCYEISGIQCCMTESPLYKRKCLYLVKLVFRIKLIQSFSILCIC